MADTGHVPAGIRVMQTIASLAPFRYRGLSDRTIQALVDARIDSPERLLFKTPEQLRSIAGIGKAALAEITAYRARFLPG
jgi:hypothetical protein